MVFYSENLYKTWSLAKIGQQMQKMKTFNPIRYRGGGQIDPLGFYDYSWGYSLRYNKKGDIGIFQV